MFIAKEIVLKKLEAAKRKQVADIETRIKEIKRYLKENSESTWQAKQLRSAERRLKGFNSVPGIPFRPRSQSFHSKNSGLCLDTGHAHSYNWYCLGRVIDGQYVVNDFYYSGQTAGHYQDLKTTLKILGVKFVTLEAPRGLQDLDASRELYLNRIAAFQVGIKYGAKKSVAWRKSGIKAAEKSLALLAKFGFKTTEIMLENALLKAEKKRSDELAYAASGRDRESIRQFQRGVESGDVKAIVKFHALNARRIAKGLPELKAAS